MGSSSPIRGENKKCLKPPPSYVWDYIHCGKLAPRWLENESCMKQDAFPIGQMQSKKNPATAMWVDFRG